MASNGSLGTFTFLRMLHSLLRHGNDETEVARAEEVMQWIGDNLLLLRKSCGPDELDLLGKITGFTYAQRTLPTLAIVKDTLQQGEATAPLITLLEEYEEAVGTGELHILYPPELNEVLADKCREYESERMDFILRRAGIILNSGTTVKRTQQVLKGPRDAVNYIMAELEKGVFISSAGSAQPVVVQAEAAEVPLAYDELKGRQKISTGLNALHLFESNMLGVLGYSGHGKSTFSRFLAYQLALDGRHVVHISLENDAEVERNKYVLLHAHHSKWEGDYEGINYRKFLHGTFSSAEREGFTEVAEDFSSSVAGHITIMQPSEATWGVVRQLVEMHSARQQVDVLFIDYATLLQTPGATRGDEQKSAMTAMIKDIRQFGLTHVTKNGNKLLTVTPIQANESGKSAAEAQDGVWNSSGINEHKELLRSCDRIVGVFGTETFDGYGRRECMLSSVKDRDGVGFKPTPFFLDEAGWISEQPIKASFGDRLTLDDHDPDLVEVL